MNIVCNNCGKIGHTFSKCPEPITSYGVIIFRFNDSVPEILMINRKKSLCYIEFIRGKYNINNPNYILILINKFSKQEKENIKNESFEYLWKDLWLLDDLKDTRSKRDYETAKNKFNNLKNGTYIKDKFHNLESILNKSTIIYEETEWEFPKGRKNNNEKNISCATRECKEETNFTMDDYELLINMAPLTEFYVGENKVKYSHIYYLAQLVNYEKKLIVNSSDNQSFEISKMGWFSKEEALNKLRDYHKSRIKIINTMFNFLENIEDYIII